MAHPGSRRSGMYIASHLGALFLDQVKVFWWPFLFNQDVELHPHVNCHPQFSRSRSLLSSDTAQAASHVQRRFCGALLYCAGLTGWFEVLAKLRGGYYVWTWLGMTIWTPKKVCGTRVKPSSAAALSSHTVHSLLEALPTGRKYEGRNTGMPPPQNHIEATFPLSVSYPPLAERDMRFTYIPHA